MPFGAFAPMPIRLGGSSEEGWSATMHARVCADIVAAKRSSPLAIIAYNKSGATVTIEGYLGQNGAGAAYAPNSVVVVGTGVVTFLWTARAFTDPYGITYPINIQGGKGSVSSTTSGRVSLAYVANGFTAYTFNGAGTATDLRATVVIW